MNWNQINKDYYNNLSHDKNWRKSNIIEDTYIDFILDTLNPKSDDDLLDMGCGNGFYLKILNRSCRAYGVDISEDCIKSLGDYATTVSKIEHTPFPNYVFDIVFCNAVIEHSNVPFCVMLEINRILKHGGTVFLATCNRWGFPEILIDLTGQQQRRFKVGHAKVMNPVYFKRLVKDSGFKIVSWYSSSIFYPGGLPIPIIGKYLSTYPIVWIINKFSPILAKLWLSMERWITSNTPLKYIGYDIILILRKE